MFKRLRGEYALGTMDSIMSGQMHKDDAIKAYMEVTGNRVKPAGLYLFPCGFLGCSSDGIIEEVFSGEKRVLEVKCPWKYRSATVEFFAAE